MPRAPLARGFRACAASTALALALGIGLGLGLATAASAQSARVLRYAFPVAETGFDPAQISDLYSRTIAANIFEAPLTYDYLARPAELVPQTAVEMPEVSDNHQRFVFTIRPGIHFADDPAFDGKPRELVAADYVYAIKRHYDPRLRSPNLFQFENAGLLGLPALRERATREQAAFDYDVDVPGVRALDRYRFEVRLEHPAPRFPYLMADPAVSGAVAREVIEAHRGQEMAHPVGTGPFRLAEWRRSSRIVLERNPGFREQRYAARPVEGDERSAAIVRKLAGRALPMLDRVEISIVEEAQPRWLGFLTGEFDLLERLPAEFSTLAIPHNRLAPNLHRRGVRMQQAPLVDVTFVYFQMEHPVVGGYAPEKVALRRAIGLAFDVDEQIELLYHGQAIPAQTVLPPMVQGHDPALRTEMSEHSRARAKALLDLYGYVDRDGDGWRDLPDGKPLALVLSTQPDQISRRSQELWARHMGAIGLRLDFRVAKWPENLKASRAGQLMMWGLAWAAATPDSTYFLDLMYGPAKGGANHSRFDLPAFNEIHERQRSLPDGPERSALIERATRLGIVYMPYKLTGHRIATDLTHPWVQGYLRHPFMRDWWRYVDVDPATATAQR